MSTSMVDPARASSNPVLPDASTEIPPLPTVPDLLSRTAEPTLAEDLIEEVRAEAYRLYAHPQHPDTQSLLSSFPDLSHPDRKLIGIPGVPPRLDNMPPGCPFAPRCPHVFDRCRVETPVRTPVSPTQGAWCHLLEQGARP